MHTLSRWSSWPSNSPVNYFLWSDVMLIGRHISCPVMLDLTLHVFHSDINLRTVETFSQLNNIGFWIIYCRFFENAFINVGNVHCVTIASIFFDRWVSFQTFVISFHGCEFFILNFGVSKLVKTEIWRWCKIMRFVTFLLFPNVCWDQLTKNRIWIYPQIFLIALGPFYIRFLIVIRYLKFKIFCILLSNWVLHILMVINFIKSEILFKRVNGITECFVES